MRIPSILLPGLLAILVSCGGGGSVADPPLPLCGPYWTDSTLTYYSRATDIPRLERERVDQCRRDVGISVGVLDEGGSQTFCYGKLDRNGTNLVDSDTLFEIGSITKVFTATLFAEMVVKGEIGLEDPLSKHLPAGVVIPTFGGYEITLLQLATHTSALPRDDDRFYQLGYAESDLYRFLSTVALKRSPGSQYEYSNLGMAILGFVLTRKTGLDYETLLQERICHPLGMTSTWSSPPGNEKFRLVTPHDGAVNATGLMGFPHNLCGAGAIVSSTRDMLTFVQAASGMTDSPLKPAFALALQPRSVSGLQDRHWIGLAWGVTGDGGTLAIGHGGATYGCATNIIFDPTRKKAVVVLTNSRGFTNTKDDVAILAYNLLVGEKTLPMDRADLALHAGTYRYVNAPDRQLTISMDGDCLFLLDGGIRRKLFPDAPHGFFLASSDERVDFEMADGIVPSGLILRHGDETFRAIPVGR
jgi:CubicO group peptidase (beta-lactamase class C family)